ncbi:MAG: hypothetical protein JXA35_05840 [Deltaproteobacteria bacterium]|nr:hypothetical protein [Deltaproteobacteria bacterium]
MHKGNNKILVCQLDERVEILKSVDVTIIHNSLSCLNEATSNPYDLIIIDFSVRARRGLLIEIVELCRCLKVNPLTNKKPLFVSIDRWHREIAVKMKETGVDYMDLRPVPNRIDPQYISNLISDSGISVHITRILSQLCPFMNYELLDNSYDFLTCGAWHNRMVLGGKRLHELCETEDHLHCEYFLNPVSES